ncbi:hypothetical protein VIBNIAM115_490011 [Vibrio nigripulchritudo AM115]|nr:hypothetical protein VIBNIAM115_490011 [Vibrio nigripulchritudo AM115]
MALCQNRDVWHKNENSENEFYKFQYTAHLRRINNLKRIEPHIECCVRSS